MDIHQLRHVGKMLHRDSEIIKLILALTKLHDTVAEIKNNESVSVECETESSMPVEFDCTVGAEQELLLQLIKLRLQRAKSMVSRLPVAWGLVLGDEEDG